MTAVAKPSQWISPEEYLEGERFSEIRHEYIDGSVYAMAGASDDHNRIALNLAGELSNRLRGGPCETFINDMKVKVSHTSSLFYYPDVIVVCDTTDNAKYFRERPTVIFEVISPETERTDRREKLLAYREILTLQSYVIIEHDRMAALLFRRTSAGWTSEQIEGSETVLNLPALQTQIPLGPLYERTAAAKAAKSS
jgi:Uma2 family endonuclease